MTDIISERELLCERLRELDEALDNLTRETCPCPTERAQKRIKLCAEYTRVVKILDEMAESAAL